MRVLGPSLIALVLYALAAQTAGAQGACASRGDLDAGFCDADGDLTADAPADGAKLRNPGTLVFAYSPEEDPAVFEKLLRPFTEHLGKCVGKPTIFQHVQSNSAQIDAMRSGRLHIAAFSTGTVGYAVNVAGAVPFAAAGVDKDPWGYHLIVIVKKDSPIKALADLKDKRVAHTSTSSNSGNIAPRALFPALGVKPDEHYKVLYSGKHDTSILGVRAGDYDAAPVASDVFFRMVSRGQIREDEFRVIWRSQKFPNTAFAHPHDLDPALRDKIAQCFFEFKFTGEMQKALEGTTHFVPVSYKRDWDVIRKVVQGSGESLDRAGFERLLKREQEARAKAAKK